MKKVLFCMFSVWFANTGLAADKSVKIKGKVAQDIYESLVDAGAEVDDSRVPADAPYLVSVAKVRCTHAPTGYIWAECSFLLDTKDDSGKPVVLTTITNQAFEMIRALEKAGIKLQPVRGVIVKAVVDTGRIECFRAAQIEAYGCLIQKAK
jgi:hypothetical protein